MNSLTATCSESRIDKFLCNRLRVDSAGIELFIDLPSNSTHRLSLSLLKC